MAAYCAQRADLRGYYCMLTTWCEVGSSPDLATAMDRFVAAINEIDKGTKAVLSILTKALSAT